MCTVSERNTSKELRRTHPWSLMFWLEEVCLDTATQSTLHHPLPWHITEIETGTTARNSGNKTTNGHLMALDTTILEMRTPTAMENVESSITGSVFKNAQVINLEH